MASNENLTKVLKRCFGLAEWAFLKRQNEFAQALAKVETVSDVETMVYFGRDILRDHVRQQTPPSTGISISE